MNVGVNVQNLAPATLGRTLEWGRELTGPEQGAVRALLPLPADIDFYIEWPTFVVFFCGC